MLVRWLVVTAARHSPLRCATTRRKCVQSTAMPPPRPPSNDERERHGRTTRTIPRLPKHQESITMHGGTLSHPPRVLASSEVEKIGVRAFRAMGKVTISRHCGLSTHHFRCLQPPRGPHRSGRAASTHGNLVAPLLPAVNASYHGSHVAKRRKHSPADRKRRIAGWRRVRRPRPESANLPFLLLRSREARSC